MKYLVNMKQEFSVFQHRYHKMLFYFRLTLLIQCELDVFQAALSAMCTVGGRDITYRAATFWT